MPTCPHCGASVPDIAASCTVCGKPLAVRAGERPVAQPTAADADDVATPYVASIGDASMSDMEDPEDAIDCPNCGNSVPADAEACPVCGHLHVPARCATHPDRDAAGACVVCGRTLCEECDHGAGTEYQCEQHQAVTVVDGWAEVYSTGDDLDAELVRDSLQGEGIDAQVLSQKDHFSFTVDLGDLARVRVLVPAFEYEDAMRAVAGRANRATDLPETCPSCGAVYQPGDTTCAACGASLV